MEIKLKKDFGKISTSKANSANAKIKRIADSSKNNDQKAREIEKVFADTYKGTGLDVTKAFDKKVVKKMLDSSQLPIVSDKRIPMS